MSVLISAVTMASVERIPRLLGLLGDKLDIALSIVAFTVPGVTLGAQLASRVASHIPQHVLERRLCVQFILVAARTLGEVIL